jgi:hypothetical protein
LRVAISGSGSLLERTGLLGRLHGTVRMVVRPPIPTAGSSLADRDALLARVRWIIASSGKTSSLRLLPLRGPRRRTPPAMAHSRVRH